MPSLDEAQASGGRAVARCAALLTWTMARALYTLLWWLALPLLPLRLWWRGRREPGYRERIGERFGAMPRPRRALASDVLWMHAVSLGETRAAAPLIERLAARASRGVDIVLTHMTATGREAGRALYGDRVVQAWLPYDVPFADSRVPRALPSPRRAC